MTRYCPKGRINAVCVKMKPGKREIMCQEKKVKDKTMDMPVMTQVILFNALNLLEMTGTAVAKNKGDSRRCIKRKHFLVRTDNCLITRENDPSVK
jgi:hypothetical protein